MSFQSQPPKSSGNGKTTLKKGGRDPPDVSLDYIVNDLLSYFNEIKELRDAEKEAENKYVIKKEHDDCWPADDIKRAWGKTQRMEKESPRRRHWTLVIMMQMIERQRKGLFDMTVGGHLVQSCGELSVNNTPDRMEAERENGRREDDRQSTVDMSQACGKAQRIKVIPEDRSSQSNAELETVGAAGRVKQCSGGKHTTNIHRIQPCRLSQTQDQAGTQFSGRSQATGNYFDLLYSGDGPGVALQNEEPRNIRETICIRIPLLRMFNNELVAQDTPPFNSTYKLIDGLPSEADLWLRKDYALSFNNQRYNAEWVYEILNRDTLVINGVVPGRFGAPYYRGHLAAAANHRLCQEARDDANLDINIVPQHETLNSRTWFILENHCRNMITGDIRNVHVYSGPLYIRDMNPQMFQGKAVPSHFFKVIIKENNDGTVEPECYVVPNGNLPSDPNNGLNQENPRSNLEIHKSSFDDIERFSGLTFIERRPEREMNQTRVMVLMGDVNGAQHTARIEVRLARS